jgi:UDP-N-acetylglucosamine kinase
MSEMVSDEGVQLEAVTFAKANKKRIARELTDPALYPGEPNPVAVFI